MKTDRTPDATLVSHDPACGHGPDVGVPSSGEGRTRAAVARLLMEQGPVTAVSVATELELSGPAVRRHLDAMIADGEADTRRPSLTARPRGRGRPAKEYVLTDAGRVRFGHGYDDLASSALRFLAEQAGTDAVDAFARKRVNDLLGADRAEITAPDAPEERADALARVLSARGYAAQARHGGRGVQLCQHHCPVAHVAAEFPELCEAETKAFAELLGTHVQRLATIARGDAACTTHVPLDDPELFGRSRERDRKAPPISGAETPLPVPRVRTTQDDGSTASGAVNPQPSAWPRATQDDGPTVSGAVNPQPSAWLRKMQEEESPAEGGSISHHGPREGGSPNDRHS